MHNRISYNQLAGWLKTEQHLDNSIEQTEIVNDYFDCLIECEDDGDQSNCERVCKEVLV